MAPLDLRGRVTITNGASGTLGAIQSQLAQIGGKTGRTAVPMATALNNAMMSGALATKRFQSNLVGATAGTWALVAAMRKAESFNRNVFGVGVAAIGDYTSKVLDGATGLEKIVVDYDKVAQSMERVATVSRVLAREVPETPTKISGIAETLAKAGFGDDKLGAATKWAAVLGSTDTETAASDLGAFASVLDTIYKPKQGEAWGNFFKRQLDIVRIAAAETRLSLASTMEGLRPFSALYSILGQSETENAMLLMGGVRKGGEATEVGHTLKSNMLRMLRSTAESTSRFSALGLRRSDYTDLSAMDPMRATGNLSRVFRSAGIKGKFRQELETAMQKAIEDGTFDTDAFQDKMMAKVAKAAKVDMNDQLSRDAFEEKFANAIFAGGARFNMTKLLQDLITKGATAADIGTIFEGRRIGTNTQILEGLKEFGPEFMKKLEMADGTGLEAVLKVLNESDYGRLQRFSAMLEDFQIKLANSGGFQTFLTGITTVFDKLGQLNPAIVNIGVAAGIAAIALAPIGMALRGIAGMARVLKAAVGLLGLGGAAAGATGLAAGAGGAASAKALMQASTRLGPMGAAATASSRMVAGMSAAAAAGGGAAATGVLARLGLLGRAAAGGALRFLPGVGLALAAGGALYGGYQAWNSGADAGGIAMGAGKGAIGLGGDDGEPAPQKGSNDGGWSHRLPKGEVALREAERVAQHIDNIFSSIDLAAAGQAMMASLAAGITAGGAQAVAAARAVAAQVQAAGSAIQLNTGVNMAPNRP